MLSANEIDALNNECKYKSKEISLLSSFMQPELEIMAPLIIVEGPISSGKTYTINKYLENLKINHNLSSITIQCDFCFTKKAVLQKLLKKLMIYFKLFSQVEMENDISLCDGVSNFTECLKQILNKVDIENAVKDKPILIVLDRLDRLPIYEISGDLVACLAKLHEQSMEFGVFSFVIVVNRSDYFDLSTYSIPNIFFESYNLEQIKQIISENMVHKFWKDNFDEITEIQKSTFFKRFVELIIDTYGAYFGSNLELILPVLLKVWDLFYIPVFKKGKIITKMNDVLTTFLRNKKLLTTEYGLVTKLEDTELSLVDAAGLQDNDISEVRNSNSTNKNNSNNGNEGNYDLSTKTKYLLIAAFLASYNEPKNDMLYFAKGKDPSQARTRRNYKKRKTANNNNNETENDMKRRSMIAAQSFKLERLLAILRAIYEENVGDNQKLMDDVELMNEIATLSSLKTLTKLKTGDTIGGTTKWRCNIHWNVIKKFSDDVGFDIENHLQD